MLFLFLDQKTSSIQAALNSSFWALFFYLLLATTVHPWYIAAMMIWLVLANQKIVLYWAFFAGLTYINYQGAVFHENLWLVALEYIGLFGLLLRHIYKPTMLCRKQERSNAGSK